LPAQEMIPCVPVCAAPVSLNAAARLFAFARMFQRTSDAAGP
jgi:hypothetical protein